LPAGNFRAQVAAGAPGSVRGVAQQHEYEQAHDGQSTRSSQEGPLVIERSSRKIEPKFHVAMRRAGRSGTSIEHPANQRIEILMDQILRTGAEFMGLV